MPDRYTEKPAASEHNPYYSKYIDRVPAGDIIAQLETQAEESVRLLAGLTAEQAEHRYAPGKWSIKEVVGHIADAERIFAYRALRIGRGDATPLASFDENTYVPTGEFGARTLADLIAEFRAVRAATVAMYRGFPVAAMTRLGTASDSPASVRALAWTIAGHELHHMNILRERYLA